MSSTMESSSFPMLKECCCGCSLRTGSMIIGFITLVAASILAIVAGHALLHENYGLIDDKYSTVDTVIESSLFIVRILQAVASILLIVATHWPRSYLVLPWLVIAFGVVIIEGTSFTVMLSYLAVGQYNPRIISMATHVCITIYFYFVVFSYYREMKNRFAPPVIKA